MTKETIVIGGDGAGFTLKQRIKPLLVDMGFDILDVGSDSTDMCHYPVYARDLAMAIKEGKATRGILCCGSGVGVCMMVNRFPWVRACQVYNPTIARMTRDHNNANVACFGENTNAWWIVEESVKVFLNTSFSTVARHQPRQKMLSEPFGDFF